MRKCPWFKAALSRLNRPARPGEERDQAVDEELPAAPQQCRARASRSRSRLQHPGQAHGSLLHVGSRLDTSKVRTPPSPAWLCHERAPSLSGSRRPSTHTPPSAQTPPASKHLQRPKVRTRPSRRLLSAAPFSYCTTVVACNCLVTGAIGLKKWAARRGMAGRVEQDLRFRQARCSTFSLLHQRIR